MEATQFATRYFVVYVGWTFDGIPGVGLLRRVPRSAGHAAPPAAGRQAPPPLFVRPLDLEREVPFVSHLRNLMQLRLKPVDMLLLVLEDRREQLA